MHCPFAHPHCCLQLQHTAVRLFYFSLPCCFKPSLKAASTSSTLAGSALYPMRPTLQTFPAVPPKPPEISRLYLSMAFLITAAQSTPSGTCTTQQTLSHDLVILKLCLRHGRTSYHTLLTTARVCRLHWNTPGSKCDSKTPEKLPCPKKSKYQRHALTTCSVTPIHRRSLTFCC